MEEAELMEDVFSKIKERKASDFPVREVQKIKEETRCIELLDLLLEQKSPVAMVFDDDDNFLGILRIENLLSLLKPRKTDISDVLARTQVLSCITAFDLVKRDLPIVKDNDDISRVAGLMDKYDTIFLPRCREI
ncbi:MAG: CBS domain-containing protein [Candidatus Heimdallarchaeaceae archaeon]